MLLNRSSISICLLVLLAGISSALVGYSSLYLYLSPNLPSVESLRDVKFQTPLRIYSADNKLIGEFGERRSPIKLSEVSPLLIKAFLAAEDDSFYAHNGFDFGGFLRATSHYLLSKEGGGGGSTLTMQVAKNSFMSNDQAQLIVKDKDGNSFLNNDGSLLYKAVQILLALKIEQELSKDDILEIYLNQIFLGHRSFGVQAAAQTYYGQDVMRLNLAQSAVIAGIPPGPTIYNPVSYPERALRRRGYTLQRMLDLDYISQAEFDEANSQPISAKLRGTDLDLSAPYVREMARTYMEEHYGKRESETAGYRVYTTVDSRLQAAAQDAVINGLMAYDDRHGYRQPEHHLEPVYYAAEDFKTSNDESNPEELPLLYPPIKADTALETDNLVPTIAKAEQKLATVNTKQRLLLNSWLKELKSRPTYGGFQAAAVVKAESTRQTSVDEDGEVIETTQHIIDLLTNQGEIINLPWGNGPSTAKRYIDVDRFGHPPEDTSFLKVGDVIRVQHRKDGSWHLVQIPEAQGAIVALDPNTGAIKSLVGGFDYNHSSWNRITQAKRQPGSNFKPFLYTIALEQGYTPATIINDAPYTIEYDKNLETSWRPTNSGDKFRGPMRLREALYRSVNNVAIRTLDDIGTSVVIRNLPRFGFDTTDFAVGDMSISLGTQVMRPLEVATAYAVFANGGYKVENHFIDRIELQGSDVIYQANFPVVCRECEKREAEQEQSDIQGEDLLAEIDPVPIDTSAFDEFFTDDIVEEVEEDPLPTNIAPRVLEERTAFLMYSMMQDVITKGTAKRARDLRRSDIAGKTATTNDNSNAWFSGYNNHIVASAWVGFDQNLSLGRYEEGGLAALPIWIDFMRTALRGVPDQPPVQPQGIVSVRINPKTGLRTHDPRGMFEYFLIENVPDYEIEVDSISPIIDDDDGDAPTELF